MNYEHKPTNTVLELWNSKGSLFQNGKLLFRGDGYIAIKMFKLIITITIRLNVLLFSKTIKQLLE